MTTPNHDDMAVLAQAAENIPEAPAEVVPMVTDESDTPEPHVAPSNVASASSTRVSLRKCIYEWMDAYYSTNHHHSLKNQCRVAIRTALRVPDEEAVDQLELPPVLRDYLLLRIAN